MFPQLWIYFHTTTTFIVFKYLQHNVSNKTICTRVTCSCGGHSFPVASMLLFATTHCLVFTEGKTNHIFFFFFNRVDSGCKDVTAHHWCESTENSLSPLVLNWADCLLNSWWLQLRQTRTNMCESTVYLVWGLRHSN